MYKKIYVEITNNCNLSCPFCLKTNREKQFMTFTDFQKIMQQIKGETKYLYLHVLGEPLMHPDIEKIIDYASKDFNVNITTNGYLIKRIHYNKHIRQLNISLHSFNPQYGKTLDDYLKDIFAFADNMAKYTYISYRLWANTPYLSEIIKALMDHYYVNIDYNQLENNLTLATNVFLSKHEEFVWPEVTHPQEDAYGTCYALRDHIAILVDGTVVPCCLDGNGIIKLGNIYQDTLAQIRESPEYMQLMRDFQNNKKSHPLCQNCHFIHKKK